MYRPLSADLPLARLNARAAVKDDSILAARKGHPRGSRPGSDADMAVDGASAPEVPTTIAIDAAHALDLVVAQHGNSDPSRLTPPTLLRVATNASAPPKPAVKALLQVSRQPPYYSPIGMTARQSAFLAEGVYGALIILLTLQNAGMRIRRPSSSRRGWRGRMSWSADSATPCASSHADDMPSCAVLFIVLSASDSLCVSASHRAPLCASLFALRSSVAARCHGGARRSAEQVGRVG